MVSAMPQPGWKCLPITCTEAVMLCTQPATVVTVPLIINPSHPSFRGTHVDSVLCFTPVHQLSWKQPWWIRSFPAVLRHLLSQISGEALKWADSATPLALSLCSSQINVPSKAEPLQAESVGSQLLPHRAWSSAQPGCGSSLWLE